MFGNVTALEGLHMTGIYMNTSMQHACSRHAAWDPHTMPRNERWRCGACWAAVCVSIWALRAPKGARVSVAQSRCIDLSPVCTSIHLGAGSVQSAGLLSAGGHTPRHNRATHAQFVERPSARAQSCHVLLMDTQCCSSAYSGISRISNSLPLGPYSRTMPTVLW